MNSNYFIAIMAGGVGSRFWPASREAKPKQFLDMLGVGKSLLRMTYDRFLPLIPSQNMICVTNRDYSQLVHKELPMLPINNILTEPARNNTAPSILYTALIIASRNPNAIIGFVPSDHLILKEGQYLHLCDEAFKFAANNDAIVTLGIEPNRPDTGYGYIRYRTGREEIKEVISFHEKPDLDTANTFLSSGEYLWNAGMFFMSVQTILNAYRRFEPEMLDTLSPLGVMEADEQELYVNQFYPQTRNVSVDYAILERSTNVFTIPADIGWSDLGTWASLYQEKEKGNNGNVTMGENIIVEDTYNSLICNNAGKLVILRDISDLMVVVEEDVVLVYPLTKEQEIKQLKQNLASQYDKYL